MGKTKRHPISPVSTGKGEKKVEFRAMETERLQKGGDQKPAGPRDRGRVSTTWNGYEPLSASFGSAKFLAPKIRELSGPTA